MGKRLGMILICALCLLLSACGADQTKDNNIMEEIQSAPVAKLEYSGQESGNPVFSWDPLTMSSLSVMRIQPAEGEFTEEWVYRFTYNPREKVINGHEIVVLFGKTSMSIDGVLYQPEDVVAYKDILGWAEVRYDYTVTNETSPS